MPFPSVKISDPDRVVGRCQPAPEVAFAIPADDAADVEGDISDYVVDGPNWSASWRRAAGGCSLHRTPVRHRNGEMQAAADPRVTPPPPCPRRGVPLRMDGSGPDLVVKVRWVLEVVHPEPSKAGIAGQLLQRARRQPNRAS